MDGSLTRWKDPIPKDAPSPHEAKKVEQTSRSRVRAMLLGEATDDMVDDVAGENEKEPDVDLDDDMLMDDDFVVDDLGGGMLDDEPELDKWKGEGVREMGKASQLAHRATREANVLSSERDESAAPISTWLYAYGGQAEIPGCAYKLMGRLNLT